MTSPDAEPPALFNDLKFFLSATVPQRSWCADLIKNHGGKVVPLEKNADILLVDHMKKDLPPGSYSFKFIDRCLRAGKLLDLEEFRAGPAPGNARPVGSVSIPARGHRVGFTAEDDQILYDWVKPIERQGGPIRGNKIYQQLEEKHPQHTYQSWRDRYLKVVKDRPRPVTREDNTRTAESTIPPEPAGSDGENSAPRARTERSDSQSIEQMSAPFLSSEEDELLRFASKILEVDPALENDFWAEFAQDHDRHTPIEWKNYFHTFIRPKHIMKMRMTKGAIRKSPSISPAKSDHQPPHSNEEIAPLTETNITASTTTSLKRIISDAQDSAEEQSAESVIKRRRTIGMETATVLPSASTYDRVDGARRRATDYIREPSVHISALGDIVQTSPSPIEPIPMASGASAPLEISESISQSNGDYETAPQEQSTQDIFANLQQHVNDVDSLLYPTLPRVSEEEEEQSNSEEITEKEKEEIQELDQWIESRLHTGRAKDKGQIIQALSCTSMNPYLADKVLDHLNNGEGIPNNIPGIWTEEDDSLHDSSDSIDIKKLEEKHGTENFDIRGKYLNTVRQLMSEEKDP
ncbi:hypothetical protein CIHG_01519 [Coccidioides immitis H538.4]|uniref:DNA-binding protein RAP1 n=2 Tax=Coccidioides immitis TaxID=5501 RepID=A0A0J8RGJ8_COCIT|nr:hypothetical protein CIRG_01370 [Coccidioides immitis RMSCC 2394]KMU83736.1 hypothetical protein CIHG_01519 [Coccidioides immitis H538.4]